MDGAARIGEFMAEVERVAGPDPATPADGDAVARLLSELAGQRDLLAPSIAELPVEHFGAVGLHTPSRGPRLLLIHRPEGTMGYAHSHSVWVALAGVQGVETHERYEVEDGDGARAALRLVEARALRPGDVVTMTPPHDVHSHGHVEGTGDPPYALVLTGDDQFRYERREFDLDTGAARVLPPGDFGTLDRP